MPRKKSKDESDRGFRCQGCGVQLNVISSKPLAKGLVRRIRCCPLCDHIEITEERPKRRPTTGNGVH